MVFSQLLGFPFQNIFSGLGWEVRDGSSEVKSGCSGKRRWHRERLKGSTCQKPMVYFIPYTLTTSQCISLNCGLDPGIFWSEHLKENSEQDNSVYSRLGH